MSDMQEIVSVGQVHRLFLILAVALPIVGLACGALLGTRRGNVQRCATQGLLLGLLGPVNFGLWLMYNAITDKLGLDTVKNLLVNLGIFVVLGIIAGVVGGTIVRRGAGAPADESAPESPGEG